MSSAAKAAGMLRNFVREGQIRKVRYAKPEPLKRWNIVRGDNVVMLAGSDAGKAGKVLSVDRKKNRVVVDGLNVVCKHCWGCVGCGRWLQTPQSSSCKRTPLCRGDAVAFSCCLAIVEVPIAVRPYVFML